MRKDTRFDLESHLAIEHKITPATQYLKEIVYGGNDGIVTTFAVVAGFSGAQANPATQLPVLAVLLFGFANLFADGISMALGDYMSTRAEQDVYFDAKRKERHEILVNPDFEKKESIGILVNKGFTPQQAADLIKIYRTNTNYWTKFMMNEELCLPNPERDVPIVMSLITFVSFIAFGFIPLTPFIFMRGQANFLMSIIATFFALLTLGLIRWRIGQQKLFRSVGQTMLLGGVAALTAYIVGSLFKF